jgi:hypothetical protein
VSWPKQKFHKEATMLSRVHRIALFCLSCTLLISVALVFAQSGPNQVKQALPISLGTSGGNVHDNTRRFCCSGTLGALVADTSHTQFVLSNNHVLADTDTAAPGDAISQPGLVDVGCVLTAANSNTVANFSTTKPLGTANVDAALAQVVPGAVKTSGDILEVGVPSSAEATPIVGMAVAKSGRTTGLTCATIGSVSTNVRVQYQRGCGKGKKFTISYVNQVLVSGSAFSAGGDSGSLIVTQAGAQPVGLLFAGSSATTIANPISDVTNAFGVTIVGGSNHAVACPAAAAGAAPAATQGPLVGSMGRAHLVKEAHADGLMQDEAVIGVGVGADPADPSEAVVVIYLEQGRMHAPIPAELDGVRTLVVRTDAFRAFGWNEPQTRPCRMQ